MAGAELVRLATETRKMLRRVARKCERQGIEGYDGTDEWLGDLDDIVRLFDGFITHQDVVTMVEAIQNTRWEQFPEMSALIWTGTDIHQCTALLDYLHRGYDIGAVARITRKRQTLRPYTLTVSVSEAQYNRAQEAKTSWFAGGQL